MDSDDESVGGLSATKVEETNDDADVNMGDSVDGLGDGSVRLVSLLPVCGASPSRVRVCRWRCVHCALRRGLAMGRP